MRRLRTVFAPLALAALVASGAGAVSAQDVPMKPLSGTEVAKRTKKLLADVHWTNDIEDLKKQAEAENKLIFWLEIVGELDGGL
jgi:hypothetical protein